MNKGRDLPPSMKEGQTNGGFFLHPSYLQFSLVWNRSLQCSEDKSRSDHKQNARLSLAELRPGRRLTLQHKQSLQQGESLFLSSSLFFFPNLPLLLVCQHFSIWLPGRVGLSQRLNVVQLAQKQGRHSWGRVSEKACNEQEVPHEEICQ